MLAAAGISVCLNTLEQRGSSLVCDMHIPQLANFMSQLQAEAKKLSSIYELANVNFFLDILSYNFYLFLFLLLLLGNIRCCYT